MITHPTCTPILSTSFLFLAPTSIKILSSFGGCSLLLSRVWIAGHPKIPLTILKQSFAVITGRHSDAKIKAALLEHDAVVIMKAGIERPRLIALLKETQRFDDANYLEYISRDQQKIIRDLNQLDNVAGPYFSLFVITREELTA